MKSKISIADCRRAIGIAYGIPLMIRGEQVLITRDLRTQGQRWVSGNIRFTPKEKELLTKRARAIIADKGKAPK